MKVYKETANLRNTGYYPKYSDIVANGLEGGVYNHEVYSSFSQDELNELGNLIEPDRDMIFTFKGLFMMNNKYCMRLKGTKGSKILELPQHAYLRMAIFSFWKESKDIRISLIKKEYDIWSTHGATVGSPRILNSNTPNSQLASCVLMTADDNTDSITSTGGNAATYSKFSGGLSIDVCNIRSSGSNITGNRGFSNGPVPFIKIYEQIVASFNQGGSRPGACNITFPFWHHDVMNMLVLKDAGGTEDNRARKLKYSMRIHDLLRKRVMNNELITLFNPDDVPLLCTTYGEEFEKAYLAYEKDNSVRKKKIPASEIMYEFNKNRKETGNIYAFFSDNVNIQGIVGDYVGGSNLCTEITVSSKSSKLVSEKLIKDEDGQDFIVTTKEAGEIGLCNLASINLVYWYSLSYEEKVEFMDTLLRGYDNVIDYQLYPVKEAKYSNINKRPIGIGVSDYAHLLANQKLKFTDEATLQFTHELFEDVYYHLYLASNRLAKIRGPYNKFKESLWAKGETPLSLSILNKLDSDLNFPLKHDWDKLSDEIRKHGVRFSLHGAIAPTATSGKIISATESTEPLTEFFYMEEGTTTVPALAPNIQKNRIYYELAWNIPSKTIIDLAAIRQKFIDQAQSINTYYIKPESAADLTDDLFYAMQLGIKTLYYLKTPKANFEICESCT